MTAAFARYEIADPVYKQLIYFCIGGNSKQLLKTVVDVDGGVDEDHGEFSEGISFANRGGPENAPTFWVWIRSFNGSVEAYELLAHELVHLLQELLDWLEIDFNAQTTEPCAAFYGHLFEQILTILRKRRKNGKAKV